jgi:hypothetical protein
MRWMSSFSQSPVLAGRAETSRPGLVAAQELLPARAEPADLVSVRQRDAYLFLRYRLRSKENRGAKEVRLG